MKRTNLRTKVERVLKRIEKQQKHWHPLSQVSEVLDDCAKMLRRALR
jgi:thiamine biosynthesis lipoprotein ApbE